MTPSPCATLGSRPLLAAGGAHGAPPTVGSGGAPGARWAEMCSHRAYLVRYAQRKLHDPALAEDVVHDVFEAVLSGRAVFRAESSLRVWLMGTLKHKIVDLIRQRARLDSLTTDDHGDGDGGEGDGDGATPCPGLRPDELAEQRELVAHALARIQALPPGLRIVMQLQALKEWPTDAVCKTLAISENNLFVRMHRARKLLAPDALNAAGGLAIAATSAGAAGVQGASGGAGRAAARARRPAPGGVASRRASPEMMHP